MMYVKHFVTCKALCTHVGDCSHYGHYYLSQSGGVGVLKGSPWGQVGGVSGEGRLRDFRKLLPEQQPGQWSEALAG